MNAHEIIIRPIITEKTMRQNSEDNKISFEVAKGANKTTVAIAIEQIYGFKPVSVNIMNVRPKDKRVGSRRLILNDCHLLFFPFAHFPEIARFSSDI